jgi:mono/diheme cytochrome c family protein
MRRPVKSVTGLGGMASCLPLLLAPLAAQADVDFAHQVVPILKEHCSKCHMETAKKGGFSMNTRESLLAGSENGAIVEPGKADESILLESVLSDDKSDRMPPKGPRVPEDQAEILKKWIDEGMAWEPGFSFGKDAYEPPLKPRRPQLPPVAEGREHPVDRLVDAYFADNKVTRPQPLGDAAFIRRLTLDLTGLLPAPEAIDAFVADKSPDKREKLITATLARDVDYAEHWLSFWNDLLRNDYQGTGYIDGGRKPITGWLYQSLVSNKPYDQFARELLAPPTPDSRGFIDGIQWRGSVNASQVREIQFSQSVSQTFLGLNMKCASCHDSFVDRWKLDEAYGLAAIYSERPLEIARCDKPTGRMAKAGWIFPELGEVDANAPQPERLKQLAGLMTHPENGRFTRTIVNRLWHRLMGRGIVHPVDAMDTQPWDEDLLDYLAVRFADDGYDLKKALAFIASSQIYQSQPVVTAKNADATVFRGPLAKRMSAEQFVDAVWTLTGTAPAAPNNAVPRGKAGGGTALSARWIWSDANASSTSPAGETITLGTEVTLPSAPLSAKAVFIADNEAEIFVNGVSIIRETIQPEGPRGLVVDLKDLRAGKNSIVVVARNGGSGPNPAGFLLEGRIELPDGKPVTIASGPSWKWTSSLPDAKGKFARPPKDWQPAQVLANPGVWDRFVAAMPPLTSDSAPMVRASLVTSDMLMRALGRPNREQIVSMRPDNITTLEAIDLANGEQLAGLLQKGAASLSRARKPTPELIDQVFMRSLGRRATAAEKNGLGSALGTQPTPQAIEDLLWMVILLPEFQFVR